MIYFLGGIEMYSEDCSNCYYYDYVDDTSESNAKMCYLSMEQCSIEHQAACLAFDKYPDNK